MNVINERFGTKFVEIKVYKREVEYMEIKKDELSSSNSNKNPTQCDRLLDFMLAHAEGITQIEALNSLGILRLASRISELKDQGYPIEREMVKVTNRFGEGCRVARYTLVKS